MKDSLWSIDLFRCESIFLKSFWVLVVMDQYSRKIVGFSVRPANITGVDVCCMFNKIVSGKKPPKYLSSDNDPLFRYLQWRANMRIIEVKEIKSVPYTPTSHPYIERLIGTVRRECLDHLLFFNERDLQKKLDRFKSYYNAERAHSSLDRATPENTGDESIAKVISIENYGWKSHVNELFHLPVAA